MGRTEGVLGGECDTGTRSYSYRMDHTPSCVIHSDWEGKIIRVRDGHALPHSTHNNISSFASARPIPSTSVGDKSRNVNCVKALKTAERPASNLYYVRN
jgi:hypothetical protein